MNKKEVIEEIQDFVLDRAKALRDSEKISDKDKLSLADVYLDIYKFLKEYDKNVKILNDYRLHEKFKSKDFGDDDRYNY